MRRSARASNRSRPNYAKWMRGDGDGDGDDDGDDDDDDVALPFADEAGSSASGTRPTL